MFLVRVSQTFIPEKFQPLITLDLPSHGCYTVHSSFSPSMKTPRDTPVTTEFHRISSLSSYIVMKLGSLKIQDQLQLTGKFTHPLV